MSGSVLDASGLLAYLQDEEGASDVTDALARGATISTANLAEALSKLAERGAEPREVLAKLEEQGVLGGLLDVEPLTIDDAIAIARLRPPTREHALGLGDRACLALGIRLGVPVMTADHVWLELEGIVAGLKVHALRA